MLICNAFDGVSFHTNNEMSNLASLISIIWTLVTFILYFVLVEDQLILAYCEVNLDQFFQ